MDRDINRFVRASALSLLAIFSLLLYSGCSTSTKYTTVPRTSAGVSHSVDSGTVTHTKKVRIEGTTSNVGVVAGAGAGGSIGRTVGRGDGSLIAGAAGIVAGAVIGPKIEKAMTAKIAQEVTVQMDDGGTVVIVQELEDPEFREGDRVAVLETRSGWSRIRHYDEGDEVF